MIRRIVPIVEGHSEARSVPEFLRRLLNELGVHDLEPDSKGIREHRQKLIQPEVLVKRIQMAEATPNCAGVLILMDADDDAACVLAPQLLRLVEEREIRVPCRVVFAVREVESWLLAGIESLRGYRGVREDAEPPPEPEAIRGAKERLGHLMARGYKSTIDQLPMLMRFDYESARRRAPSLDKFLRDIDDLVDTIRAGM